MAVKIDRTRAARLDKALFSFLKGGRTVSSQHDAQIFFEAVRAKSSPSNCLETILANTSGLEAVRKSVRASMTAQFISTQVLPFISYLAHPDAKAICDGQLLEQIVLAVVEPPTAWNAMLNLYVNDELLEPETSIESFAWLCHEVVNISGSKLSDATDSLATALKRHPLVKHSSHTVREFGYQIQKVLDTKAQAESAESIAGLESPGGRHDNDFANFRDIAIYPTTDEFASNLQPFYRRATEVARMESGLRANGHLDNQFRLLREDMLAQLRDDIQVVTGQKKSRRSVQALGNLWPVGIETGDENRGQHCSLLVSIGSGLEVLLRRTIEKRKEFLEDNRYFLRHQTFGALCVDEDIIGFAFVVRDIQKLANNPPVVGLHFTSSQVLIRAIMACRGPQRPRFVLVDTPVFAYEPILQRLQMIAQLPLEKHILCLDEDGSHGTDGFESTKSLASFLEKCRSKTGSSGIVRVGEKIFNLDAAQLEALTYALESPMPVIQGPPGTGKSFIGALAAKILLGNPDTRLLVLAYTNHALDQFLEDLRGIGISSDMMSRLGSKFKDTTADLSFESQFRGSDTRRSKEANTRIFGLKDQVNELRDSIDSAFENMTKKASLTEILDYLEFSGDDNQLFWRAFQIPTGEDGYTVVSGKGKEVQGDYLIDRWRNGKGPGAFKTQVSAECKHVWNLPTPKRVEYFNRWTQALGEEQGEILHDVVDAFTEHQNQVDTLFNEAKCNFIRTKRVIGCTTTAAAKYSAILKAAKPDCVLVEEAGEILEAHVLTALGPTTKQLILIGDHKQLRPKCNNYALTVERGDGYDLNRSLFERLILQGHRHVTLQKQHRMVPEISQLIRTMTYPDLLDDTKTLNRPVIRGLHTRVAFINHSKPEALDSHVQDRRDEDYKASKQNEFEAAMILKLVKFLGQQGYGTGDIVVLTPYLGQLRLLRDILSEENDPLLSDLDSYELIRAGVLTSAAGQVDKKHNYQGEESDIVIVSMTRSNNRGDIGFMKAAERLNVLISRARNCLIMIGNMETFMASPKGKGVWVPFFTLMKEKGYLQDGLQVYCEKHPERSAFLSEPEHFNQKCPDGGCTEACDAMLACGLHICERKCHRLEDHSMTRCSKLIEKVCDKQHLYKVKCDERHVNCEMCSKEEEDIRRRAQRDLEIEKARLTRQAAYRQELQKIDDEIAHEKRIMKQEQEEKEQARTLQQRREDLAVLKQTIARKKNIKKTEEAAKEKKASVSASQIKVTEAEIIPGSAKDDWEYQKRIELASNPALETLMQMIGLEEVKKSFLGIKNVVDTAARQGVSTKNERFGCSLLGNPGTGKTTVARLYAQLLTSMGVIAGSCFKETTGSKLANMGVSGCQNLLDEILNEGGGVIFIDEAYQLSSGNSPGGKAVLDFILAEVENLNSQVCFILAGYSKQMESFFAHNPGFPSRFPCEMKFGDYTDEELLQILESKTNAKYGSRMKAEDGLRGLYCRVATRRLGRGRGKEGFGNARAVENLLARICRRQSERLRQERRAGLKPDDLLFTKEDIIGPEPSNALLQSEAWGKLQQLIGLKSVKESVKSLLDSIQTNYARELEEKPIIEYNLNRVFLGSPGTGKTTVAKIYGQILVDLGMLSNGEVILKNPSDFVGSALGQSEQQTKGILAASVGKVLVLDEAYGLYGGGASQGGGVSDPYKTAVVDTIVAEVQSTPGDDRCVLLLGYKDQMEEMFQNVNPGLSRRFPISSAFVFEDFDQTELAKILDMKLKQQGYGATEKAKQVALEKLDRARNRPNFGNAGEVDILLNEAKSLHQKRVSLGKTKRISTLEALDFDENYARMDPDRSVTNVAQLFKDTVGCERIVATLQGFQQTVRTTKALGLDPKENIPFNFLFRGPPGTGKTTTARKMGKVFYDCGFLASADVLDCSASDLIGQYVGQTGPKVRQMLDKALGRVLLVDEAYRLAEGHFAKEAMDEIVDSVTKEKYHKRLIIILAGYENDINRLLSVNPGLTSRFPEVIDFYGLDPTECFNLLTRKLSMQKASLESKGAGTMEISCLETPSSEFHTECIDAFDRLSKQEGWASARDVETLAKAVFKSIIQSVTGGEPNEITVSEGDIRTEMIKMVRERENRAKQSTSSTSRLLESLCQPVPQPHTQCAQAKNQKASMKPEVKTVQHSVIETQEADQTSPSEPEPESGNSRRKIAVRDAGVSDEVWDQLQKDRDAEEQRERDYQAKLKLKNEASDEDLRDRIIKELIEEEERRRKEAEFKKRLEMQGRCPVGYEWIRQEAGWRCAGGSHFVSELEMHS